MKTGVATWLLLAERVAFRVLDRTCEAAARVVRLVPLAFLAVLAVLFTFVAAAFVVEGGMESWSALFLERQLHAHPTVSGLGPGIFGASMAAGRFFGQAAHRVNDRVLLAGGAAVGAVGCVVAASATSPALGVLGFAIGGAGVSLNAPIVFGLAGRRPDAATAIATVTTLGYLGLLVGPPLVGLVAQVSSLRMSFGVLAAIAACVAIAALRLRLDPA